MKPTKPYDPSLREAAEEFKAICRKHNCMGVVLFISPSHSEFVNHISGPSWSVMKEEEGLLRFRSKAEDFPSSYDQKYATEATVHAVTTLTQWFGQNTALWEHVLKTLRKHMTILYKTWNGPESVPGDGK